MDIGHRTLSALMEKLEEIGRDHADYCDSYGEPGYWSAHTQGVILGNYWCRCDHGPESDEDRARDNFQPLHGVEYHYPRVFAALEEQGFKLEWCDEWWIDYETGKAWRTQADSYSWQPSIIFDEEMGDYLTPDHDADVWIEWGVNNPDRCIPRVVKIDLGAAGFEQWEPHNPHTYESGWHPGQTDDPREITKQIRSELGDDVEVVFQLDATGQFDVRFSAWVREGGKED